MKSNSPTVEEALHKLRDEFVQKLPERFTLINALFARASTGDDEAKEGLLRSLHSLVGAGGTYGFLELSQRARVLEHSVRDSMPAPAGFLAEVRVLASLVNPVTDVSVVDTLAILPTTTAIRHHVLYFAGTDAATESNELLAQLQQFQWDVTRFHAIADLKTALSNQAGHCVLIIDTGYQLPMECPVFHAFDADTLDRHQLILGSRRRDFTTRLQAAKLGAVAVLHQPINVPDLIEVLDQPGMNQDSTPYRVLIVDDDRCVSLFHSTVLESAGMQVQTCVDVERLDIAVQDFAPELILLDVYMPQWDGPDIARALRMETQFLGVPLVFLSSEENRTVQLDAMREGGDDFLVKPIQATHLIESVRIRAQRYRELRSVMLTDPLTHVLNRRALFAGIDRELSRARRLHTPLVGALLDIDHFKRINDSHGHHVGDTVIKGLTQYLRQRLRKTDLIGRMGGEEFLVVFPETDAMAAWALLDDIRDQFGKIDYIGTTGRLHATFSAGLAIWQPEQSTTQWLHEIDKLLYVAKTDGRNRVMMAKDDR